MFSTLCHNEKQRYPLAATLQNFNKAMGHLEIALAIEKPDIEMSFELTWNVVKDFLEEQGFVDVKSPRAALKKAFEIGVIDNGHYTPNRMVCEKSSRCHSRESGNPYHT